ncbi:hypothetical protein ACPWT1_20600 [Ramlibacter sp. MMS24-I3-19]|uniref:hypothetical protein n=1 Tax=Ramlibacter sp. MMS24-I3-19 TaxID=3416606 RepID=UPI003D01A4D6
MTSRFASNLAFAGTVLAASFASALMAGGVRAETYPTEIRDFAGTRSRAEVQAEVTGDRSLQAASNELSTQGQVQPMQSGYTRAEARAGYIASRDEVRALNGEDSGSAWMAHAPMSHRATQMAAAQQQ